MNPPLADLHIQLLGGFRLTQAGSQLQTDVSPALQSLLAYLLLLRGTPQTRVQIAFALFPDSSNRQAQSNLRTLLVRLKRVLPEAGLYWTPDAHSLEWRLDAPCELDVAEFERAAVLADRAGLERAASLYPGDLLPDCYDDWILPQRERLRQLYLSVIERLSDALERDGDFLAAILRAQQMLQFDPFQETFYQRLMRLHARRGDYAGMARTYQSCQTILQQELGIDPGPDTRALYESLQANPAAASSPNLPPEPVEKQHLLALTPFIGRRRELAEIKRLLGSGSARLLTLTGPGGVGKTSLAVQAGRDLASGCPDGVWFVDLSVIASPQFIPNAIAAVLGVRDMPNAAVLLGAQPHPPLQEAICRYLGDKRALLLVDNCEHLLAGCARVVEMLLSAGPGVQVLATSRTPLGIKREHVLRVPPLALPAGRDYSAAAANDAVRLFAERGVLASPAFVLTPKNAPFVADICRRLDGLPLAIELAAARLRLLSVEQNAARLDERFNLLTAGEAPGRPRHHSLRDLFEWSYDLLSGAESTLLRRLAVFGGGFTLEAAEYTTAGLPLAVIDLLAGLVDQSLVTVEAEPFSLPTAGQPAPGGRRYRMLDTIRRYALEKLEASGEMHTLLAQRLEWCVSFAEQAAPQLVGAGQADWLARLEAEHNNFGEALQWALEFSAYEPGLRLAGALWRFWNMRGYFSAGTTWLEGFLERASANLALPVRALALHGASALRFRQGQFERAVQHSQASLAIQRGLDNPQGAADSLNLLGVIAVEQGAYERAEVLYAESLELRRALQDSWGASTALINLGLVARNRGDFNAAARYYEQALELKRQMSDQYGIGLLLNNIGDLAIYLGDYPRAALRLEESIALRRELGDQFGLGQSLNNLAVIACYEGDAERAGELLRESLALHQALNDQHGIAIVNINYGMLARARGDLPRAAGWYEDALAIFRKIEHLWGIALASNGLGEVMAARGDLHGAAQSHRSALQISQESNNQAGIVQALEGLANVASLCGQGGRTAQLLGCAAALHEKIGAPPTPPDRLLLENVAGRAGRELGAEAFEQAHAAGRLLSIDQAIELAFTG